MPASTCAAVVDLRPSPRRAPTRDELLGRGVRVRDGWTVVEALPGPRQARLEGAMVARIAGEGATPAPAIASTAT